MTTTKKIAVMQAYVDGKIIEYRTRNSGVIFWFPCEAPAWNWEEEEYRVRKNPRTPDQIASEIIHKITFDIALRAELGEQWELIEDNVIDEIVSKWRKIIIEELEK